MIWIIPLEETPQHVGWLLSCEKVLALYPTIIQALIAIGTIGAVIKAVWPSRVKLKVFCQSNPKVTQDADTPEDTKQQGDVFNLHIMIYNKGIIPAYIIYNDCLYSKPYFYFGRLKALQTFPRPRPLEIQPKRKLPLSVTPQDLNSIREIIRKKYHRLYLVTQSGEEFKIKISKDIKKALLNTFNL